MTLPSALPPDVERAFRPLHKRGFGIALGAASGLFVFAATAILLLRHEPDAIRLGILCEYFYGYTVSWAGAFIGLAWGFFAGYVAGWFAAFVRNFVMAASLWLGRNRSELEASRDFLDHI
ncbi:MAG TPA: hypothetical protein VGI92_08640 [Gemmatimonadales bacterium]